MKWSLGAGDWRQSPTRELSVSPGSFAGMTGSQTLAWLDQRDARVARIIRKHGQFIQYVDGGRWSVPPTFAYTVGLHGEPALQATKQEVRKGLSAHL